MNETVVELKVTELVLKKIEALMLLYDIEPGEHDAMLQILIDNEMEGRK